MIRGDHRIIIFKNLEAKKISSYTEVEVGKSNHCSSKPIYQQQKLLKNVLIVNKYTVHTSELGNIS